MSKLIGDLIVNVLNEFIESEFKKDDKPLQHMVLNGFKNFRDIYYNDSPIFEVLNISKNLDKIILTLKKNSLIYCMYTRKITIILNSELKPLIKDILRIV